MSITANGNDLTEEQIEAWRRFLLNEVGVHFGYSAPAGSNVLCDMAKAALAARPEERAQEGGFRMDVDGWLLMRDRMDALRYRFIRSEASHTLNGAWAKIAEHDCVDEKMDEAIDAAMRLHMNNGLLTKEKQ